MTSSREPDLAGLYHLGSASTRSKLPELDPEPETRPAGRRLYPGAERVPLPGRDFSLPLPLGEALERRTSRRDLRLATLPLATLGRLLHGACSVHAHRPYPSAGGLHPLEVYALTQQVEGLPDGIWHYDPWVHELVLRRTGAFLPTAAGIAYGQGVIAQANVLLCLTAVFARTLWKYGQRGYRYVLFEAGHVGQNLYLVADALGLAHFSIGGFFDHELNALLDLPPGEEEALYLFCTGQAGEP